MTRLRSSQKQPPAQVEHEREGQQEQQHDIKEKRHKKKTKAKKHASSTDSIFMTAMILFGSVIVLRILVGYQPHSGQDNYHGAHGAYGGDFEAQRHWMELTWQLPLKEWYWYDLQYWGLDYPPLSAYLSYVCGGLSHALVGPESVALETSRGYEDRTHKSFMRATVLVLDIAIYGTAVWKLSHQLSPTPITARALFLSAMTQPAILLMDHGHFQYNTTSLGLLLWSIYYMTRPDFANCIVASVSFCGALLIKQMNLYYAPVVFAFLLGRCCNDIHKFPRRFVSLGLTVVSTCTIVCAPFVLYGPDDTTMLERAHHVFRRIIPLQRGLFEDKVANLWCALSVQPFRLRHRIPTQWQPIAAISLTTLLFLPACIKLFHIGRQCGSTEPKNQAVPLLPAVLWGMTSCALSFFLASFQVHEKSLLMALAPASLLLWQDTLLCDWFSIVVTWTLWPLVVLDRLQVAYVCTVLIFMSLIRIRRLVIPHVQQPSALLQHYPVVKAVVPMSFAGMLLLHLAYILYTPPTKWPDLFPVLWSIAGCGMCCCFWCVTCYYLYSNHHSIPKQKTQ
jgi:alpha-1,3-glucosyltransferase